jgi:hypothetical protein
MRERLGPPVTLGRKAQRTLVLDYSQPPLTDCFASYQGRLLGNSEVPDGIKRTAFVLLTERVAIRFNRPNQDVPDGRFASWVATSLVSTPATR